MPNSIENIAGADDRPAVSTSPLVGQSHLLWDLPDLPFTEIFGDFDPRFPKVDQGLYIDEEHSHVFLLNQVNPGFLYNRDNYAFLTNESPKILAELEVLLSFITDSMRKVGLSPEGSRGLEFGANTTAFSDKLARLGFVMTAVDPVFEEYERDYSSQVEVVPQLVEEFLDCRDSAWDLVVARHTLEHIANPLETLRRLGEQLSDGGLIVFEVPDFASLVSKLRFDAVFHQHLHYFDLGSITSIARAAGLEVVSFKRNPVGSNGGSLMVCLARLRVGASEGDERVRRLRIESVDKKIRRTRSAIGRFEQMMALMAQQINSYSGETAVFGAGLMLPTLDYHLKGAIAQRARVVFDDDRLKIGLGYRNLPLKILNPPADLQGVLMVIGGLESSRGLIKRCYELGAALVLAPLVT